ncbi:MAG: 4-(cytidine 5'-diphospho)-2-C-methyl-D-erythritol kinase, partial [Bacteroidales bacterium]|nr:4-(cytidine 5'-diphospho)-2-C-methyl-D-erythritol kinase [Bacteroidales bacterium]
MILFPGAKINLFLRITKKRHDGFHNIDTLFYPVPFHDILEIIISGPGDFSFSSSGIPTDNDPENNLVVRAYYLFSRYRAIHGVSAHLHKQIPVGGGLGGGSSDAASCLIGLNSLTDTAFTHAKLREMAIQLGSDCPFFIKNKPL